MQIHEITLREAATGIEKLDIRRDPSAPRPPVTKPASAFAQDYAQKMSADPAQAAFAQRMAKLQQPKVPAASPPPPQELPPITLGSGPNAQVFINRGRGYVDKRTGEPIPPAIAKVLSIQ